MIPDFIKSLGGPAASSLRVEVPHYALVDADRLKAEVVSRGVHAYYSDLSGQAGAKTGGTIQFRCWHPGHDDKIASLCVSAEHGGYECKGCGEKNDLIGAWMVVRGVDFKTAVKQIAEWCGGSLSLPPPILSTSFKKQKINGEPPKEVKPLGTEHINQLNEAQDILKGNERILAHLRDHYGISREAAIAFGLGWSTYRTRLMIPVYINGSLVNIRMHDITRSHCVWVDTKGKAFKEKQEYSRPVWAPDMCRPLGKNGGKVTGVSGHNSVNLYPTTDIQSLVKTTDDESGDVNPWICITGGELKAVFLNSMGIPAVCFTGGEGSFSKRWLGLFKDLRVDVCMDADDAGVKAAGRLANALRGTASQIRIVRLPLGDPNDYYRSKNWTFDDWWDLPRDVEDTSVYDEQPKTITFGEVHDVANVEHPVVLHAIVAGGTDSAKFVISGCITKCTYGEKTPIASCKKCALPGCGFEREMKLKASDIIELSASAPSRQEKFVRENLVGVPARCRHPEFTFVRSRIMPILLAPDSEAESVAREDNRYFVFPTYYMGSSIPGDSESVEATGRIAADPMNSKATMIVDTLKPSVRSIYRSRLSETSIAFMSAMLGDPKTAGGASDRIGHIMKDMEYGVCRIYDQRSMMLSYLLLMFMPLRFFMFGERNPKASAELLVMGDTRQGKSTAMISLMNHFQAGQMIPCEGATFAGLVGGTESHGTAGKLFSWGVLPMNDGGMVFMDEIDDIVDSGVFGMLTSIRSDGIATRTTAGGFRRTASRLRMIMASNPVGNRTMTSYDSMLHAARDLVKKPADLARFELVVGVYEIKDPKFDFSTYTPTYKQDIAQEHIRWAWKQSPKLSDDVSNAAVAASKRLCDRYRNLPMLPPTESRWKVARVACAVAALAYSTNESGDIDVTTDHVDIAEQLVDGMYSDERYKLQQAIGFGELNEVQLKLAIQALGGEQFARMLQKRGSIKQQDLRTAFAVAKSVIGMDNIDKVIAELTIFNECLIERRNGYIKSDQFRRWLDAQYPQEA